MTELPQQFKAGVDDAVRKPAPPADDRRKRTDPAPSSPYSLRFTFEERSALEAAAGSVPLAEYIREVLFGSEVSPRRRRGAEPVADHQALAQVLGALGASRLSSNLNQLAHSANIGALPVLPETEEALQAACDDIRQMRVMLVVALGHRQDDVTETGDGIPELEP